MIILKLFVKIVFLPVILAVLLIQWIGIFLNSISGVVMGILSFIFVMTGIACLLFGLASGSEALKMIIASFVIFLIPHIGNRFKHVKAMIDKINY